MAFFVFQCNVSQYSLYWCVGIAEDNSLLAKWCVVTPVVEKRIHQAATSLFSQLNKDSRCVLSSEDYMSAVKDFSDSIRIQNLLLATGGIST